MHLEIADSMPVNRWVSRFALASLMILAAPDASVAQAPTERSTDIQRSSMGVAAPFGDDGIAPSSVAGAMLGRTLQTVLGPDASPSLPDAIVARMMPQLVAAVLFGCSSGALAGAAWPFVEMFWNGGQLPSGRKVAIGAVTGCLTGAAMSIGTMVFIPAAIAARAAPVGSGLAKFWPKLLEMSVQRWAPRVWATWGAWLLDFGTKKLSVGVFMKVMDAAVKEWLGLSSIEVSDAEVGQTDLIVDRVKTQVGSVAAADADASVSDATTSQSVQLTLSEPTSTKGVAFGSGLTVQNGITLQQTAVNPSAAQPNAAWLVTPGLSAVTLTFSLSAEPSAAQLSLAHVVVRGTSSAVSITVNGVAAARGWVPPVSDPTVEGGITHSDWDLDGMLHSGTNRIVVSRDDGGDALVGLVSAILATTSSQLTESTASAPALWATKTIVTPGEDFRLDWTPVSGATSYTLERANDANFVSQLNPIVQAGTSYTENISTGVSRYYRVKADNSLTSNVVVVTAVTPPTTGQLSSTTANLLANATTGMTSFLQNVSVTIPGKSSFTWNAWTDPSGGWLDVRMASGTNSQAVEVRFNAQNLTTAGTRSGMLYITSPQASNRLEIPVSFKVDPRGASTVDLAVDSVWFKPSYELCNSRGYGMRLLYRVKNVGAQTAYLTDMEDDVFWSRNGNLTVDSLLAMMGTAANTDHSMPKAVGLTSLAALASYQNEAVTDGVASCPSGRSYFYVFTDIPYRYWSTDPQKYGYVAESNDTNVEGSNNVYVLTLNVPLPPRLVVTALDSVVNSSYGQRWTGQLQITNPGDSTLNWSAGALPKGVTLVPASGSVSPKGGSQVTAVIDADSLPIGGSQLVIPFTSNGGATSATLRAAISAVGFLRLAPDSVAINAVAGIDTLVTDSVQVTNAGPVGSTLGTLSVSAMADSSGASTPWATASAAAPTAAPSWVRWGVRPGAIPSAKKYAGATVSASAAGVAPKTLRLWMTVRPAPIIRGTPDSLVFRLAAGASARDSIQVRNGTAGADSLRGLSIVGIEYSAGSSAGWLKQVVLSSAIEPAYLVLSVDASGVPAGSYQATVRVGSTSKGAQTKGIPVVLVVASNFLAMRAQAASLAVSGLAFTTQPIVEVRSPTNSLLGTASDTVRASLVGSGGTLIGQTSVVAVSGVATFANLQINGSGNFTLTFSATGVAPVTSQQITVSQVPTSLAFATAPSGIISGSNFSTQPVIRILDNAGLTVTTGAGASLPVTATRTVGAAVLSGATTVNAVAGIATFTDLRLVGSGATAITFSTANPVLSISMPTFNLTPPTSAWTTVAAMPTARYAFGTAVVGGIVYAIGGSTGSSTPYGTVEAYNPATNTWTTKASMPTPRFALGVGVMGGLIYAVGGYGTSGYLATLEVYDPATNTWSTKVSMPSVRSDVGVAIVDGLLYAVGGHGTGFSVLNTVEAYNPTTNAWATKPNIGGVRQQIVGASIGAALYMAGGADQGSVRLNAMQEHFPSSNSWATKASMPTSRGAAAGDDWNGQLYVVGGETNAGVYTGALEAYSPATNQWTTFGANPNPRYYLGAAFVKGVLYAIGGLNSDGPLALTESYTPTTGGSVVTSVSLAPSNPTVRAGSTVALSASARDASNASVTGKTFTWSSSNTAVATVDASGVVTGVASGTATISATTDGETASTTVSVSLGDATLVAWYRLDGNGLDASGNGRNGTVTAATPTTDRFGTANSAMHFDGATASITVPADSGLSDNTLSALTMIGWVKTTQTTGNVRMLSKGIAYNWNYSLYLTDGKATSLAWQFAGATNLMAIGTTNVADGRWHLVVGTIVEGSYAKVYVDGVLQTTVTSPGGAWSKGGAGSLVLGAPIQGNGAFLNGDLDDVKIIRRALSDAEVAALAVGTPSKLSLATALSATATSGVALAVQPVVQVRDATDAVVVGATNAVTATLVGSGGTLVGTATVNAVNGVATFSGLTINGPGTFQLRFGTSGLDSVTSANIVAAQTAAGLQMVTQPAGAASGTAFTTQPAVRIVDNAGLAVTTGSGASLVVTASVASGTGSLGGTLTATAVNGVATFSNLAITGSGSHTLNFTTASSALSATSQAVTVATAGCTWCNTTLTFDGDSLPTGWQKAWGGGSIGQIANGRLETFAMDRGIAIRALGAPAAGATAVEVISEGPMADITWGMASTIYVEAGTTAWLGGLGSYLIGTGPIPGRANQITMQTARIDGYSFPNGGTGVSIANDSSTFVSGTVLRVSRLFKSDSMIITVRRASDDILIATRRMPLPGFRLANVTGMGLQLYYTSGSTLTPMWLDNIRFKVLMGAQPTAINITPDSVKLAQGRTASLSAVVTDSVGAVMSGQTITYTSRDTTIASVSVAGLVTARIPGSAWVVGSTGTVRDSTKVTVIPSTILAIVQQPVAGASGALLATQPLVEVRDTVLNARVTSATTSITAAVATGSVTLGGPKTVAASSGLATFTSLTATGAGTFTLSFSATGMTTVVSQTLTIPQTTDVVLVTVGADSTSTIALADRLALPIRFDLTKANGKTVASFTARVQWDTARVAFDSLRGAFGILTANIDSVAMGSARMNIFDATGTSVSATLANLYLRPKATGAAVVSITPTIMADPMTTNLMPYVTTRSHRACIVTAIGKWGDVTGDGLVNIIDAQQIARYSVGLSVVNPSLMTSVGDVTNDGFVNVIDAQQIARYSVGLSSSPRTATNVGGTCP